MMLPAIPIGMVGVHQINDEMGQVSLILPARFDAWRSPVP
jgi:hypothetical protein